jgi:hypothetical protein
MDTLEERLYKSVMAADVKETLVGKPQKNPTVVRYYFYQVAQVAGTDSEINYDRVFETIQKTTDPSAIKNILARLEQSITGHGDNFAWKYIVVKADNYNGKTVVYQCPLGPDGRQMPTADRKAYTNDNEEVNLEEFERAFALFTDQFGGKYVNVQFGPNDYYVQGLPTEGSVKNLLKTDLVFPGQQNAGDFRDDMGNYRLFLEPQNQLAKPDFELSEAGEFSGVPGQLEKIKQIADKRLKELGTKEPAEESLGEKMQEQKQQPTTKEEVEKNTVQASVDDYTHEYTGGFDIMQRLVRDQHKKMKIRKEAQGTAKQMEQKAKQYEEIAKTLEDTADELQKIEKKVQNTQTMTQSPYNKNASMARKIAMKFMQDL